MVPGLLASWLAGLLADSLAGSWLASSSLSGRFALLCGGDCRRCLILIRLLQLGLKVHALGDFALQLCHSCLEYAAGVWGCGVAVRALAVEVKVRGAEGRM